MQKGTQPLSITCLTASDLYFMGRPLYYYYSSSRAVATLARVVSIESSYSSYSKQIFLKWCKATSNGNEALVIVSCVYIYIDLVDKIVAVPKLAEKEEKNRCPTSSAYYQSGSRRKGKLFLWTQKKILMEKTVFFLIKL